MTISNKHFYYISESVEAIKKDANRIILPLIYSLRENDTYVFVGPTYLQTSCFLHDGDNPRAFSWCMERNIFKCWTRRCDEDGNDIIALVMKTRKLSFRAAVEFLNDFRNRNDLDEINKRNVVYYGKNSHNANHNGALYIDDAILKKLRPDLDYFIQRGFSEDVLKSYNVGRAPENNTRFSGRMVIPIRHHDNGKIIGFTGRTTKQNDCAKWIHSPGFQKSHYLFNLDKALPHIQATETVILVEGPLDVFKLEMSGYKNSVAILGSSISDTQMNLLLTTGAYNAIIAMDGDDAGRNASVTMSNKLNDFLNIFVVRLPEGHDVGSLAVGVIKDIFTNVTLAK
jgi:DNA primase